MAIYLVQHGHSLPKEADPERGLSEQGFAEVQLIADRARAHNISVSEVIHSGKKRASQTAHIFEQALHPKGGISERTGLQPMDDVRTVADSLDADSNQMLVSHLPFLENLVSFLITGSTEKPVIKFQNGGIICLDQLPDTGAFYIKWTLLPVVE